MVKKCQVSLILHTLITFFSLVYRIVANTRPSCFEAHAGLFRLSTKWILDVYVLLPFGKSFLPMRSEKLRVIHTECGERKVMHNGQKISI